MTPAPKVPPGPPSFPILGTDLHLVDYQTAGEFCIELAKSQQPAAVSLCNTHIVAAARHDPDFGAVMRRFNLILPDGMPLIWSLNAKGAGLNDRVYGPYFMRHLIQATPSPWRHFLFGGSPECLQELSASLKTLQPDIEIVEAFSPPFRDWQEADQQDFANRIRESRADFIWVALGGERQERWIIKNLHRHERGVFLAVGDAFELLAGRRPFAPKWMQERGLTWAYRILLEPGRLWKRYAKYNALFLFYLLRDQLFGSPNDRLPH